jgi:glycosyltransferase involved in cell wall biosynthesis
MATRARTPRSREVRSLHIVTSDARRGAETFAVDLAAALDRIDGVTRVVALSPVDSDEPLGIPSLGSSRRAAGTLLRLRRAARTADVVVAHGSSTLEACAIALAGTQVPFVYRTIGDPSYWVTSDRRRLAVGGLLRRAARHVALWQGAADQLAARYGIPSAHIDVIPNAVCTERFELVTALTREAARRRLGVPPDRNCLAFVGALSPEKDVGTAIEAVRWLNHCVLLVVGEGPERARLQLLADRQPSADVRFLGPVLDPELIYAAADLLVLPSLSEGMPGVVIEAGLVGTATVASAVGSVPEMIEHGVTGYLTDPENPVLLAERIEQALKSCRQVGERASHAFRARYAMDDAARLWNATLRRAVEP